MSLDTLAFDPSSDFFLVSTIGLVRERCDMFAGPIHQKMKTEMGNGKDGKAVSGFCNTGDGSQVTIP